MRNLVISLLFFTSTAFATGGIWNSQGHHSDFESMIDGLITQKVILLGENHGLKTHQAQHMQILEALKQRGLRIHVGLEFFSYPDQESVNEYREGSLDEKEFLEKIKWGSPSFDYYREQALFGEQTWAMNAPRSLTGQVVKVGLDGLTSEEQALLPPQFEKGRDSYRKRFFEAMGGHISDPVKFERYFTAQSIWDDTMAWRAEQILKLNPDVTLVIVVGEFHTQYGGGLPDRLKARGVEKVGVVSQVNTMGFSFEELEKEIMPSSEYGPRADWIWAAPAVD